MANRPLLLVDIDGVLNPWQADRCPEGFEEHVVWPEDDVPLRLASVHGVWLRELAEIFDLVWASAWGRDANEKVCPLLDIPELPHVPFPPIPFDPAEKVPAIRHYVADRPAVWVDDSITAEAWTWAAERRDRTLLMWVPPWTGLQRPHVDYLLTWAGSVE